MAAHVAPYWRWAARFLSGFIGRARSPNEGGRNHSLMRRPLGQVFYSCCSVTGFITD